MLIHVLFFASLRERAKTSSVDLEIAEGLVDEALEQIRRQYPQLEEHLTSGRVYVAVNDEYVTPDTRLKENDTLALIPPVSGGL